MIVYIALGQLEIVCQQYRELNSKLAESIKVTVALFSIAEQTTISRIPWQHRPSRDKLFAYWIWNPLLGTFGTSQACFPQLRTEISSLAGFNGLSTSHNQFLSFNTAERQLSARVSFKRFEMDVFYVHKTKVRCAASQ